MFELSIDKNLILKDAQNVIKAAKNPRLDFASAGVLKIKVNKDHLVLCTGNGHLTVLQEVKSADKLKVIKEGECAVDASLFVNVLSAIPEDGNLVTLQCDEAKLLLNSKVGKRNVKNWIPLVANADIELAPIKGKAAQTFQFTVDSFKKCIRAVFPWHGTDQFEPEYQQILVDFLKEETRYVCGCGSRFAIVTHKNELNADKFEDSTTSAGFVFPSNQAIILQDLFGEQSGPVIMSAVPGKYEFKTDFGMSIILEGIADIKYVPYMQQVQRLADRAGYFVVESGDMQQISKLISSMIDTDYEKQNNVISANMTISNDGLEFKSEFTRGLNYLMPVKSFSYAGGNDFSDKYSMRYLRDLALFGTADSYEFSFLKPQDPVFCQLKNSNEEYKYLMLFAAVS